MIILHLLRMLVDVAFYSAFAGLFAMKAGGQGAFVSMLLICVAYALTSLGGERRRRRMLWLMPMAAAFALPGVTGADRWLMLPAAAYVIWLVWQGDYTLSRERQQQIFGLFCKAAPVFAILAAIMWSGHEVTEVTLPYGLVLLIASVLLMRSLRHDPSVYLSKRYQMTNLLSVATVAAVAWLVSNEAVVNGAAALLKAFYNRVIWPVIALLLRLLFGLLSLFERLFALLRSWMTGAPRVQEPIQMDLRGIEGLTGESLTPGEASPLAHALGGLVIIAGTGLALLAFFRWLRGRYAGDQGGSGVQETRVILSPLTDARREREDNAVRGVRRQYRKFLKLCEDLGAERTPASTSLDMHWQAKALPGVSQVSETVRGLYIRARYAGEAEAEDVQQMKKLCARARTQKE